MSLFDYKWLIAAIIAVVTLTAGLASLRFIRRYQHLLSTGDSFADGIFLGVAAFHLLPDAVQVIPTIFAILLAIGGFFLLFMLEHLMVRRKKWRGMLFGGLRGATSSWLLVGILSVHAFIAGAALGISDTHNTVSILFIAILAHKGFESFALTMGLHRRSQSQKRIKNTLWAFTFVTPLGIILASWVEFFFQTQTALLITGFFSAFAAGSFIYIGTLHAGHDHFHPPHGLTKRYEKMFATLIGIGIMGFIAFYA